MVNRQALIDLAKTTDISKLSDEQIKETLGDSKLPKELVESYRRAIPVIVECEKMEDVRTMVMKEIGLRPDLRDGTEKRRVVSEAFAKHGIDVVITETKVDYIVSFYCHKREPLTIEEVMI